MADNLTISIGADTSKLKAELEIAKQSLKQLSAQVTAAARDVAKGVGDPNRVQELTRQWQAQSGVVRQLSNEYRTLSGSVDGTSKSVRSLIGESRGLRRIANELTNFGGGIQGLTSLLGGLGGGFVGAFAGAAVGKALDFMIKGLGSMSEALTKLQDQAREFGQRPIDVQAWQELAKAVGQTAEAGEKLIGGAGKIIENAFANAPGPGDIIKIQQGVDGLFHTFKNGVEVTKDLNSPLEILHLNLDKFRNAADPARSATAALLASFVEFANKWGVESAKVNKLSKDMFNLPAATALQIIPKNFADIDAWINKLAASQRGATQGAEALNTQLKAAQANVGLQFQELTAGYQKWLLAQQTAANQWLANVLEQWPTSFGQALARMQMNLSNWWQAASELIQAGLANATQNFTNWGAGIQAVFTQLWAGLSEGFTAFWTSITTGAGAALDWIAQKAQAVVDYIKSAISNIGSALGGAAAAGAPVGPGGFASGGVVRGPGTATSDSILARLSNGEFVMRAAAVQHWGAGMLSAMNSAGTPRFAAGGLVAAGGGTGRAVHLHLGGHEFALSGAGNVVESLVVEANRQHIRSAGVKPSWYGGRPGGR